LQWCRHHTSTYPVNNMWLTVVPLAACYPYHKCYLLQKNTMLV
jgi:hypothetical protein